VNNRPIEQNKPGPLKDGDKLELGSVEIQIIDSDTMAAGRLKVRCHNCARAVELRQEYCPWCGTLLTGQSVTFV